MSETPLEEFLVIVQRDLGAESVRVLDEGAECPEGPRSLMCELPRGRRLVATFAAPPPDVDARRRRMEMLVSAFGDTLVAEGRGRARSAPALSLQEELSALAQRTGAVEVVVIDAHSPVVWGSAGPLGEHVERVAESPVELRAPGVLHEVGPEDVAAASEYGIASAKGLRVDPDAVRLLPRAVCERRRLVAIGRTGEKLVVAMADPSDVDAIYDVELLTGLSPEPVFAGDSMAPFFRHLGDADDARTYEQVMAAVPEADRAAREPLARAAREAWARTILTRRAITAVRAMPEVNELNKGAQLRQTVATEGFGLVARSFSSIYVVVLIFDRPFDELLVKRAVSHAMPTIERLVAALPPLDPPPRIGGAVAMRAPRRRRR